MFSSLLLVVGCVVAIVFYAQRYVSYQQRRRAMMQKHSCEHLRELPNKWFPPLGLDKLGKVVEAERTGTYPMLMLEEHDKHGDTYAQWGGSLYTIITRDPRNIQAILSRQFENFEIGEGRHGCVRPLLGNGIFTQDGPAWERSRKLLAPMLHRPTLPDLGLIEKHWQSLLTKIESIPVSENGGKQGVVNLKDHFFDLSFDMITEFLLGDSMSDAEQGDSSAWTNDFSAAFKTAFRWIAKRERLKVFYWLVDGREFRTSCKQARTLLSEAIDRASHSIQDRYDVKGDYIAMEPLLRDGGNVHLIRDQVLNLLLAGRDTSGSFLSWAFYALAREPQLFKSLKTELQEVLAPEPLRAPTKSEIGKLTQLDAFVTEVLRVFPPVPINGRFSTVDTVLPAGGGDAGESPIFVPKGTLIAFSTFAAHRASASYGESANRFDVDRWKEDIKERRMIDWSYHPFIGGPRKCLGERFAILQVKYLLCRVLQHFDAVSATTQGGEEVPFRANGGWVEDVRYHVSLTMSPEDGVFVRFSSRG